MAISDSITVENNAISEIEQGKREYQRNKRPRVFEKIDKHNSDTLNGSISPILRLKIKDVPIRFDQRNSGKSKMNLSILIILIYFILTKFIKKNNT